MSTVHLPDDLAGRLSAVAARRGMTVDELAAATLAELFPDTTPSGQDPLEAFIGSGSSGQGDLARHHRRILNAALAGRTAADL
jgi:hypothetical protein